MKAPPWRASSPSAWRKDIKSTADKMLARLPQDLRERLVQAIDRLPEGDIKRLGPDDFRCRVGDWRIRFSKNNALRVITILAVTSRGAAYKKR